MARMHHTILRALIDAAPLTASSSRRLPRKQMEAVKEQLRNAVEMLKHVFEGRTTPPDVAAFVEACVKYL